MFKARRGREGSRWINERPTSEQVAEWFKTVRLHGDMAHEKYVGGITLIPGKEKADQIVGYDETTGFPQTAEVTDLTWTPYMKVETRVAYFWDFVDNLGTGAVGCIEPVAEATGDGLPPGFFLYRAIAPDGKEHTFVCASWRVRITEGPKFVDTGFGGRRMEAAPILEARGTKMVATANKWRVDENALMKAETGAIGRALGVAGMLVMPGSGIATAEDMVEAAGAGSGASPAAAALPADAPVDTGDRHVTDDELRERATALLGEFERFPDDLKLFRSWAKGRGTLASMTSPALKGFVRKLERDLDAAKQREAQTLAQAAAGVTA